MKQLQIFILIMLTLGFLLGNGGSCASCVISDLYHQVIDPGHDHDVCETETCGCPHERDDCDHSSCTHDQELIVELGLLPSSRSADREGLSSPTDVSDAPLAVCDTPPLPRPAPPGWGTVWSGLPSATSSPLFILHERLLI